MNQDRATVVNGRSPNGRFAAGNRAASGGHRRHIMKLRRAFATGVSEDDVLAIVAAVVGQARAGDIGAAKFLFDRLFGRASAEIELADEELPDGAVENIPPQLPPVESGMSEADFQIAKAARIARLQAMIARDEAMIRE